MTPAFDSGGITIYNADCRDVLPLVRANVLITDPVWPNCPPGLLPGADGTQGALTRTAIDLAMPLRTAVIILGFNSDPRWLQATVPVELPFIRSQQLPYAVPGYRGRLLGGDEVAYVFGAIPNGRGVIPGRAKVDPTHKASRATGHPCPRSDAHMTAILHWWSVPDDVIVDPFLGTGATAIAAVNAGRRFVGMEIHPAYCGIACDRVEKAQRQLRLDLRDVAAHANLMG